jgi:glycosyltransferase involved in cell wall biosynthesis
MKENGSIVYLCDNLVNVSGGLRVIVEQANGLMDRGYTVEIWLASEYLESYFACNVPLKNYDPTLLDTPDIVVFTDPAFIPHIARFRPTQKSYLLAQHDNEWCEATMGMPTNTYLLHEHKEFFDNKTWEVIVVSRWVHDVFKDRYGIDSHVVENGVSAELFHPAKPLLSSKSLKVLIGTSSINWKGSGEALAAARQVQLSHYPEMEILLYGGIFDDNTTLLRDLRFPVTIFNVPQQKDLAGIISSATVFVSASWKEGFGLPGLEALACGVPLLTTDSGGVREYAVHNKTAIVVESQNQHDLEAGLIKLLSSSTLRKKLIKNGFDMASKLTWQNSINKLVNVLTS